MVEVLGSSIPVLVIAASLGLGMGGAGLIIGVRKLIRVGQFAYHNSRLSTIGNPYVRKEEVLPLVELNQVEALSKAILSDLDQGDSIVSFREVDRSLMMGLHRSLGSLREEAPVSVIPLIDAYLSRAEGEELKRVLRLIGRRKDPLFPIGWLTEDVERQLLSSKDIRTAMEVLEGQQVATRISEVLKTEETLDLSAIDDSIDRHVLDRMRDISGLSGGSRRGANAFFHVLCDRYNIHTILRSKGNHLSREKVNSMLYKGGGTVGPPILEPMVDSLGVKEAISGLSGTHLERFLKDVDPENPSAIETALDRMVLEGSIGLSHTFGSTVGPTIRFMISKEMEHKNLRTLYQASFSRWKPERTRERLVLEEGS